MWTHTPMSLNIFTAFFTRQYVALSAAERQQGLSVFRLSTRSPHGRLQRTWKQSPDCSKLPATNGNYHSLLPVTCHLLNPTLPSIKTAEQRGDAARRGGRQMRQACILQSGENQTQWYLMACSQDTLMIVRSMAIQSSSLEVRKHNF